MSNSHRADPRRSEGVLESAVVMNPQAQRSIESNNIIGGNTFNYGYTNLAAFSNQRGYIQVGVQSGKYPSSLHPYQELTQARLDAFPNNGEDYQQSQKRQRQSAVQPTIPTYNSTQLQLGPTSQNLHSYSFQNGNVSGFFPQAFTGVPGPNHLHSQMHLQSNQPTVIAQQQQTQQLPNVLEQRLLSQIHHSFQEQGFNYSQQQQQQQLQEEHWQHAQLHQQLHHTLQRTQPTQSSQLTNQTQQMLPKQHLQTLAPFFPPEHRYTQTAGAFPPREYGNATPRSATASGLVPARQQTHSEVYPNSTGGGMGLLDPLGISSSLLQAAEFAAMAEAAADRNKKVKKKPRRGTLSLGENAQKGSTQSQQNQPGDVQLVPPEVAASPAGALAHSSHLQQSPSAELNNTASHNSSPDQLLPTQHSLDHQHQSIDRNENGGDMSANALGADVSYGVGACSSSEDGAVVVMHAGSMKTRGFHYFWSVEMDRRLKEAVGMYGTGGKGAWVKIAQFVGHNVDNEQANQRWYHYLDPAQMDRRQGPWTKEEDNLLRLLVTKALSDVEESASLTGESTEQRDADCEKKSAKNEEYSASIHANGGTADQELRAMAADQENSQLHDAVVRFGGEGGERRSDTVDRAVAMSSDHATEHVREDGSTAAAAAEGDDGSGGTFSQHARRPLERELEHQQQQQLTSCDERMDDSTSPRPLSTTASESFSAGSGDDSELVSSAAAVAAALAARPPDIRVVHGCEIDFAQVSTIHHGKLSINWTFISKQLNRPYKDCQHKWYTIEALDMKKGRFTAEEDDTIARFKEKWETEGKGKGLWVALQSVIGRRANNVRQRWVNVISKRATSAAATS